LAKLFRGAKIGISPKGAKGAGRIEGKLKKEGDYQRVLNSKKYLLIILG